MTRTTFGLIVIYKYDEKASKLNLQRIGFYFIYGRSTILTENEYLLTIYLFFLDEDTAASPLIGPNGSFCPNTSPPAYTAYKQLANTAATNGHTQ